MKSRLLFYVSCGIFLAVMYLTGKRHSKEQGTASINLDSITTVSKNVMYGVVDGTNFIKYGQQDSTTYFEVSDSSGIVAYWENGKWDVTDCEAAMAVMVKSVTGLQKSNADLQREIDELKGIEEGTDTLYASQ